MSVAENLRRWLARTNPPGIAAVPVVNDPREYNSAVPALAPTAPVADSIPDQIAKGEDFLDVLKEEGIHPLVIEAMEKVPREDFVPLFKRAEARRNRVIFTGIPGNSMSEPLVVAMQIQEALGLNQGAIPEGAVILEIGTGSGYSGAVASEVKGVARVYSIEKDEKLAAAAKERLAILGYNKVQACEGDGAMGIEGMEFDAIIVTAAVPFIPENLVLQLKENGRICAPVLTGKDGHSCNLITYIKKSGKLEVTEELEDYSFHALKSREFGPTVDFRMKSEPVNSDYRNPNGSPTILNAAGYSLARQIFEYLKIDRTNIENYFSAEAVREWISKRAQVLGKLQAFPAQPILVRENGQDVARYTKALAIIPLPDGFQTPVFLIPQEPKALIVAAKTAEYQGKEAIDIRDFVPEEIDDEALEKIALTVIGCIGKTLEPLIEDYKAWIKKQTDAYREARKKT